MPGAVLKNPPLFNFLYKRLINLCDVCYEAQIITDDATIVLQYSLY
jgi:hypothetical protein